MADRGPWPSPRRAALAVAALAIALAAAACGASEPKSAAVSTADFERALSGAPPPLKAVYAQPAEILDGGGAAFARRVESLRGYPVVVNKWASWCAPCRFEFPFFQRQVKKRGTKIAFLAVDAEDARGDAREFLKKLPVPYPSYFDPDGEIAKRLRAARNFPTTSFYDRKGELVYTKQGGYASEAALADDLRQYAR